MYMYYFFCYFGIVNENTASEAATELWRQANMSETVGTPATEVFAASGC